MRPLKETHGVLIVSTSLILIAKVIIDIGFKHQSIHLVVEVPSQVTALLSPQPEPEQRENYLLFGST